MADKSKAAAIKDEVIAFLEEQRLYFKGLNGLKEIQDESERIRRSYESEESGRCDEASGD